MAKNKVKAYFVMVGKNGAEVMEFGNAELVITFPKIKVPKFKGNKLLSIPEKKPTKAAFKGDISERNWFIVEDPASKGGRMTKLAFKQFLERLFNEFKGL